MRHKLEGNWNTGFAMDLHTVASTYLGVNEYGRGVWDNTRSEMGEYVYKLKNRNDISVVPKIIDLIKPLKGIEKFDAIIPVPSSNKLRKFQPVDEISKALSADRNVPALIDFLSNLNPAQLKNIDDHDERLKLLADAITITGTQDIAGKNVLLIDDLYRSGATLNACTNVLITQCKVARVCVLTMTKTRSKR